VVITAMVHVREAAPRGDRPAELAAPNDRRLVKQAAGLEVLDQPPARLVGVLALVGYPARQVAMVGDCSTVPGANPRIARRELEESTSDPLNDDELAPNSANGSIPSLIE